MIRSAWLGSAACIGGRLLRRSLPALHAGSFRARPGESKISYDTSSKPMLSIPRKKIGGN